MDRLVEPEFSVCIEKYKKVITSKSQLREDKDVKVKTWSDMKKELVTLGEQNLLYLNFKRSGVIFKA